MRGRKPKPTYLKVVEGTARGDRTPANEPIPASRRPTCPAQLSPAARKLWRLTLGDLPDGLVTRVDGPVLARWCEATALAADQARALAATGPVIMGARSGEIVVSPAWRVYRQAAELQVRLGEQLGLSPSARARLSMPETGADDLARLLS